MIEFDCEGCGSHVYGIGTKRVPNSRLCSVCEWFDAAFTAGQMSAAEMIEGLRLVGHWGRQTDA